MWTFHKYTSEFIINAIIYCMIKNYPEQIRISVWIDPQDPESMCHQPCKFSIMSKTCIIGGVAFR